MVAMVGRHAKNSPPLSMYRFFYNSEKVANVCNTFVIEFCFDGTGIWAKFNLTGVEAFSNLYKKRLFEWIIWKFAKFGIFMGSLLR